MSTPFVNKYAPSLLNEIVFASPHTEKIIKAFSSGYKSGHLLLWGSQGTGKSSIASMLPTAIEGVAITPHVIHASAIKSIDALITAIDGGRDFARFSGGKFGRFYLVVEELAFNNESCSRFWVEIEKIQKDSLVIITTNHPMKIDSSIRSRCECLEIQAASPQQFLSRAKLILNQEGFQMPDQDLLGVLSEVMHLHDNRKYLQRLESLIAEYRIELNEANLVPAPVITSVSLSDASDQKHSQIIETEVQS